MKKCFKVFAYLIVVMLSLNVVGVRNVVAEASEFNRDVVDKKMDLIQSKIVNYVESCKGNKIYPKDIEEFYESYIDEEEKLTFDEINTILKESNNIINGMKKKGVSIDEIADSQIIKTIITKIILR